jgi:hypothetical protein
LVAPVAAVTIEKRVRRYRFPNAKGRIIEFSGMKIATATDDVRVSAHRDIALYRIKKDEYCVSIASYDAEIPKERTVRVIALRGLRTVDLPAAIAGVRPAFVRKKLQADLGLSDDAYPTVNTLRAALCHTDPPPQPRHAPIARRAAPARGSGD